MGDRWETQHKCTRGRNETTDTAIVVAREIDALEIEIETKKKELLHLIELEPAKP
jgi:hypothetical protein